MAAPACGGAAAAPELPLSTNIPAARFDLIGRTTAIAHAWERLSAYRIVSIVGPGALPPQPAHYREDCGLSVGVRLVLPSIAGFFRPNSQLCSLSR
jgi:hypothetical protein